ncbi:MAG: Arsenate reductase (EC [uncultured Sulfurovum sp.]|uniref:Arsenate reductase (EC) n=1 Tax=uncultured Sulfurovum sp. TaxID=269237 RepID=A0A6S6T5J1_9BACT|nr:MAG: Arsenate reductase (EC [uncultured Sulfurovum sp.]
MMNKKVLVMCTGNSCRSIIGEALINAHLDGVEAYSCGVAPSGKVNPNAKKVLEAHGEWNEKYSSKHLDALSQIDFDLVVTVCDHAKETCPIFAKPTPNIHVGFEDPDGKGYDAFEATYAEITEVLLPQVKEVLAPKMQKSVFKTAEGVGINFTGGVQKQQIVKMVENCATGACECMSDETKKKISNMQVEGKDGDVELKLSGDMSKEEIESALARSKVLNKV